MNYKGAYDGSTDYSKDDVVMFTDAIPYVAIIDPPAGTTCHDRMYWNRLEKPMAEIVTMFHGAFSAVPKNIDDEGITLKTDDGEYLITVDDSGDEPDLTITKIEEEGET